MKIEIEKITITTEEKLNAATPNLTNELIKSIQNGIKEAIDSTCDKNVAIQ